MSRVWPLRAPATIKMVFMTTKDDNNWNILASSVGSPGSTSASSLPSQMPDALPTVKITRKPRQSSKPACETAASTKRRSGKTRRHSQQIYSTVEELASWVDGLASPCPWPESGKATLVSAGSGPTSSELFASLEPDGSWEKTSPAYCLPMMEGHGGKFSETWPKWGGLRNGACFERATWVPVMDEPERSSWQTPRVSEGGYTIDGRTGRAKLSLDGEAQNWRTPRAEDSESTGAHRGNLDTLTSFTDHWRTPSAGHPEKGGSQNPEKRLAGGHTLDLQDQAEYWMTPNVPNGGRKMSRKDAAAKGATQKGKRQVGLENQAEFWATPKAGDWRDGRISQDTADKNSRPLNEQFESMWRTPHGLSLLPGDPGGGGEFTDQATKWSCQSSRQDQTRRSGPEFWQRVRTLLQLCRLLRCSLPSPYNKARSMFRKRLSANFGDWLHGWPVGWSSADIVLAPSETELQVCVLRRRLECLLGDLD